jgi:ribosomal protein S18 acetylase RimI-like enzyme
MDLAAVLAAFNEQVRRATAADGTGAVFETGGAVVRRVAQISHDGSGINWSDLDAGSADAVIAEQVAFFGARGQEFEWKLYDYDEPADLAERLVAAGFVAEDPESFVVAEVAAIVDELRGSSLPDEVRIERVTDRAGVETMNAVQELVFGEDRSELRNSILAQLEAAPEFVGLFVAMAGDLPVSAARIEFLPDTEFAGLWGGGTLAEWRGRGIYRALVRRRAELAAERGYRYLTVDASPDSRPILERLGFTRLAITTPYIWSPTAPVG